MISQIITRTPIWVWALLVLLVWLGYQQSKSRDIGIRRVMVIPAVLTLLSILGTVSAFGSSPLVLFTWLAAASSVAFVVLQLPLPAGNRFDPQTSKLHVLGSWVPLALMMGIFINKYVVGVALAMHPELAQNPLFALTFSALYGIFSGVFIDRAVRLRRLANKRVLVDLW